MGETAVATIQYRVTEATIDDSVVELPKAMFEIGLGFVSSIPDVLSSLYSKLKEKKMLSTSNLIQDNAKYVDMLKPPVISESFGARLHFDSEIKERFGEDRQINYALGNIYTIINESLKDTGFSYSVNIRLRDKGNIRGWERIDLVIKFPDEHYEEITRYWKAISAKVNEFYKSLQSNLAFSEERVSQIRESVYIVVQSEDW
ncbi:MAG: hypothetical protein LUQ59_11100 [Methanothrix sp.]|nr:hypothetical protein [Methanothrix sp.]